MTLRHAIAALFFVASVPVCAGAAAGLVSLGDTLLGDSVPYSCGKRGLVVGLMGIWGVVLFGILMGQVDRIATWIAPPPASDDPAKGCALASIAIVRDRTRSIPRGTAREVALGNGLLTTCNERR